MICNKITRPPRLENITRVYGNSVANYDYWMDSWAQEIAPPSFIGKYVDVLQETTRGTNSLLELGVGTGRNIPLYGNINNFVGTDITPEVLEAARKRITPAQFYNFRLQLMDSERLDFEDGSFDCIVSTFHLCVVPNLERAIDELMRVLKKGGSAFLFEYQQADDEQIRLAQEFLAETFTEHGLYYKGSPVVLWDPTRDIIGSLKRREPTIKVERIERLEKSVMLSKALLVIRKR